MAKAKEKETRNIDIWLIMVIILLVLSIGGGLYLTGQSVLARLDSIGVQTRSQIGRLEMEVFDLRKQLQTVDLNLRKALGKPTTPAPGSP